MPNNIAVSITADVADLVTKRAILSAELKAATKDLNDFARTARESGQTDELRTGMLQSADAVSKARASIKLIDTDLKELSTTQQVATGVTGQQRNALLIVGEQFRQMSTEASLGISAQQIFAQQSGQTIQAMALMFNEGSKLGAFLTGPWGIAVTTAAAVLLPLLSNLLDFTDETQAAVEKLQKDAQQTEVTRRAKEVFAQSIEGLTAAIEDQRAALDKEAEGLKTETERSYDAARANEAHAVAARKATIALLEQAQAQLGLLRVQAQGPGERGELATLGADTAQNQVSGLEERLKKQTDLLATAQRNFTETQSRLAVETGARLADPVEVIRRKYDGPDGLIEQARKKAVQDGRSADYLQQQVKALTERKQQEVDAAQKAERTGSGRRGGGGGGKPNIVQEWTEQLHQQEIASGEFFKDQTAKELAFWQDKSALTKKGSSEWLEVQGKIFEASKSLARQGYQEQLADLNAKIAADRDDWAKEQADWQEKLEFIKGKFGEQSAEYKNAHREWENEQRRHEDQLYQIQSSSTNARLQRLKSDLQAELSIRRQEAQSAESVVRANSAGSLFGDVKAEVAIARIRQQLIEQEIAATQQAAQTEAAALAQQVETARAQYGTDSQNYVAAVKAKENAEVEFQNKRRQLEEQSRVQSIQGILAVQQAYQGYISGVVGSTVSGLGGAIAGTQTWQQAVSGIYNSLLNTVTQTLTRMITNWITTHLLMSAAQRAQLAVQTAAHVGAEGAKTAATATGVAVRTGTESTGFFAKLLGLLGIHVGAHTASEAAKTAATGAAAAARTGIEIAAFPAILAAQGATGAAQVVSLSGVAAAAAFASTAAIPIVGPILAPAAAAAALAETLAFLPLASLAVGTNFVPDDMVANIHRGERIIPAAENAKLIQMVDFAASASGRSASSNDNDRSGGDEHYHYHDHTARGMSPSEIIENRAAIAKAVKMARRDGML